MTLFLTVSFNSMNYLFVKAIPKAVQVMSAHSAGIRMNFIIDLIVFGFAAVLMLLSILLIRGRNRIKADKEEIENSNELRKMFIDTDENLVYLKDENLKYVIVNKAMGKFLKKTEEEIIGNDDYTLAEKEIADLQRQTDWKVIHEESAIVEEMEQGGRVYKIRKYPVKMLNGKIGVGAYIKDITEERENENRRNKTLKRITILAELQNRRFNGRQEQLDYVLRQSLELAESRYGYIFLYNEANKELIWNCWTDAAMAENSLIGHKAVYKLEETGLWGEAVRRVKPIIINDFEKTDFTKRDCPSGHIMIKKFMSFPVVIDEKIVAVVGLANKQRDYDDNDVYEMTLLMNGVWNAIERKEAQEKLAIERNKYRQAIVSIGDGVMVVDKSGNVEMLNRSAEELTGWSTTEAYGRHYGEVFVLSNGPGRKPVNDPVQAVLTTGRRQEFGDHEVLISKDNQEYFLEDSAAPIKDDAGVIVGAVLVFRDVTDKKEQREKIEYLSFHDSLTGLYNRRFFEEELRRLDTERNLPLAIIMGDINGLKLTNDIFGHSFGDILLQKAADVLRKVCRADDIIARWGGDEFVLLLPKTDTENASQIIERIKTELGKVQIKAIKGSISMGVETKKSMQDSIVNILDRAEENMYLAKTLERDNVQSGAIDTILKTLHDNSIREKEHSERVSELCYLMGVSLKLPETEIRKLKEAGYLHDLGKIVLDPKVLNKNYNLSNEEWNEIKRHPIVGYRILNSFDNTLDISEAVLAHQERWDGTGYPKGLKGEEIPLLARIISVAESYDRMIHDSDDTKAMGKSEACRCILGDSGTRFDPHIAEFFVQMVKESSDEKLIKSRI